MLKSFFGGVEIAVEYHCFVIQGWEDVQHTILVSFAGDQAHEGQTVGVEINGEFIARLESEGEINDEISIIIEITFKRHIFLQ
jgi:hypothetical protein